MTTSTRPRATVPAWQGWVRSRPSFPTSTEPSTARRIELGAAVFSMPEGPDAQTTSWVSSQGQFCAFTGYLYNRQELAKALALKTESPERAAPSPAEVVLAAYREWGFDVLSKLDGSFGLAIWDQSLDTLLCGRDPIGLHPFYYSLLGDELVFSWDMEAVLRHPRVSRELNRVALAEHLVHHWWNVHETLFQAVRRLPAAHGLKFVRGRHELFRYWNPLPINGSIRWVTPDEMNQFPVLFRKAVECVMEAGRGRTGIFLSGGLDSVSVASCAGDVAAERGWQPPHALSVIFPGTAYEEPVQRAVAQELGFPQTFTHLDDYLKGPGLLRRAIGLNEFYPAPAEFPFAPAFLELQKLAQASGVEVVLTGEGGDEVFGVTPALAADLIRRGDWKELGLLLRSFRRYLTAPAWQTSKDVIWTYGIRALLRDWAWKHAPGLALRRRRQLLSRALPPWLAPDPAVRRDLIWRFEQKWQRETSQGSFYLTHLDLGALNLVRHMSFEEQFYRNLTAGVPTLHPYWHPAVADFLLRTPPQMLQRGGVWKSLVRSMVRDKFPWLGFDRQKKVVTMDFPKRILRSEGPLVWQQLCGARSLAELGLVDFDPYHRMLSSSLQSDDMFDVYRAWHGASTESWVRSRI